MKFIAALGAACTVFGAFPVAAHAQVDLSFSASQTSECGYRGISESWLKPALAGGIDDTPASGSCVGGIAAAAHGGERKVNGNRNASYTDDALAASNDFDGLLLLDADVTQIGGMPAYASPSGKNLGRAGSC